MAAGGWEGRWTGGPQRILRAVEPLPVTLHWWTHDTMLCQTPRTVQCKEWTLL